MRNRRWVRAAVTGVFVVSLGLGLTGAPGLFTPVEAAGPPKQGAGNNRCDEKHPDKGRDHRGHNNPKCEKKPEHKKPEHKKPEHKKPEEKKPYSYYG